MTMGWALVALGIVLAAGVIWFARGVDSRQREKAKEPHPHDVGTRWE